MVIKRSFYRRNTLKTAQGLLGCFLIRQAGKKLIKGIITEVEAYVGEDDLACHAAKGRTKRTELMYGEAGYAYIYLVYGMYYCLNIVTAKKDFPAAVLIRAIKIKGVDYQRTNGPGKLCRFLKIGKALNGHDLTKKRGLWLEKPARKIAKKDIAVGKRIGIEYARHCRHYLWRFYIKPR